MAKLHRFHLSDCRRGGGVEDSAAIVYDQDEHEMFAYIWAVLLLSD